MCLAPQPPFRPILPSAPASLPPHTPFRPILPSAAPYPLPPRPRFRPSLQLVGVRGCLSAEVECDGAALASCRLIRCRVVRPWLRGLQCTHVRIRWHPTNGLEQELWLTHLWNDVCATKPARPAANPSSSMRSDAKSRPHGEFAPAAGCVEGHIGAARFLCMTCIEWVVGPAAAMTWRIR